MTLFTLLKDEHDEANEILKELKEADKPNQKKLEEVCQKLLVHMDMEEKYLYPEMKKFDSAEEMAQEAELEHGESRRVIKILLNGDLDDVEQKVNIELLQMEIKHHTKEEESDVFPEIRKDFKTEKIDEITEKMLAFKEKKQPATTK